VTDQGPGVERSAERAIRKLHRERSAGALVDALRAEADAGRTPPCGDVAIVALRYLPAHARGLAPGLTVGPAAA
jgi:hypothetical protein